MTQKDPEGQGFKSFFGYFRRNRQLTVGQWRTGKSRIERGKKRHWKKCWRKGFGETSATLETGAISAYLPANDSAALAAKAFDLLGMESITFISCQSYGNSLPQPRHAT